MNTPEQTYKKLSDAVQDMHFGHEIAKKHAAANEKLPLPERAAGRREYIRVLQELQANAQATLAETSEYEQMEMFATQFGARKLRHCT